MLAHFFLINQLVVDEDWPTFYLSPVFFYNCFLLPNLVLAPVNVYNSYEVKDSLFDVALLTSEMFRSACQHFYILYEEPLHVYILESGERCRPIFSLS